MTAEQKIIIIEEMNKKISSDINDIINISRDIVKRKKDNGMDVAIDRRYISESYNQ